MASSEHLVEIQELSTAESLDVDLEKIESAALARLTEEVKNEGRQESLNSTTYNRTYHRHNR